MTQPTHLRDIATDLLARARTIQAKPVTAAVERVDQAIERLRSVLLAYDEHAATRRQIEQLEARLVEARAKLRGGGVSVTAQKRTDTPVDCPRCGRTCASAAGLTSHVRNCTGQAA